VSERFGAPVGRRHRWVGRRRRRPGSRVAILGGTGLLGAAVARRCIDEGWDVTVLARHRPDERTESLLDGAQLLFGDAMDVETLRAALDGAAHVVDTLGAPHPAASAAAQRSQFDPVLGELLAELRRRPDVGLTYLSSGGAIYGDAPSLPVNEETACHPVSPYGAAKLEAEERILATSRDVGLKTRILRVGNAYGARQRARTGQGVVATMLHAARTGAPVTVFGDGGTVRDYVDARDVAEAVVALRAHAGGPQVLNVGTGIGHRVLDVRTVVEEVTGSTIELRFEPRRSTDVTAVVLDVTRLAALVPWRPRSLLDGVADAWREVRSQPPEPETAPAGAR
jgi:UDP-glucose 4-epimerase